MAVKEILKKEIESTDLVEIELLITKSHIIHENGGIIYCSVFKGLKGLFRKDKEETAKFGRKICDEVKEKLCNDGFFTSDELPNYGISEEEVKTILEKTKAGNKDLVAIFVYDKKEAQKTKDVLDIILRQARNYSLMQNNSGGNK